MNSTRQGSLTQDCVAAFAGRYNSGGTSETLTCTWQGNATATFTFTMSNGTVVTGLYGNETVLKDGCQPGEGTHFAFSDILFVFFSSLRQSDILQCGSGKYERFVDNERYVK